MEGCEEVFLRCKVDIGSWTLLGTHDQLRSSSQTRQHQEPCQLAWKSQQCQGLKAFLASHCLTVFKEEMLIYLLGLSYPQTLPFASIFLISWLFALSPLSPSVFPSPLMAHPVSSPQLLLSCLSFYTYLLSPISTPSSADPHHCHFCPPHQFLG